MRLGFVYNAIIPAVNIVKGYKARLRERERDGSKNVNANITAAAKSIFSPWPLQKPVYNGGIVRLSRLRDASIEARPAA